MAADLKEFARRADEAEQMMATLQRQIDYLSTVNSQKPGPNGPISASQSVDIEGLMLTELSEEKMVDSRDFANKHNLTANDVYGAINSLEADGYITKQQKQTPAKTVVSSEGIEFIENGSPECILMNLLLASSDNPVPINSVTRTGILEKDKMFKVAQNKSCKNKWIRIDKKAKCIHKLVWFQSVFLCSFSTSFSAAFSERQIEKFLERITLRISLRITQRITVRIHFHVIFRSIQCAMRSKNSSFRFNRMEIISLHFHPK